MARQQGSTHASKWLFMENGHPTVRNVQRIEVQTRGGKLYSLTGDKLPDYVVLSTGHSHRGESVAQILERPGRTGSRPLPGIKPWPEWRDLIHVVIGLFAIGVMNFIVSLASPEPHLLLLGSPTAEPDGWTTIHDMTQLRLKS